MNRKEILENALKYAETTREFICESGALRKLSGCLERLFPGRAVILTADEHTWEAAGSRTASLLSQAGIHSLPPFIFPGEPMLDASVSHAQRLAAYYEGFPEALPVAVGSGTINDLVKLASHMTGRTYASVPTASSVDGYAADGAPVLKGGCKVTVPCPAPAVITADTDVLAAAPRELTSSGYGDLSSKIPAGADWLLADALGEDKIDPEAWQLVQEHLEHWLQDPLDTEALFIGLTLCGIAMQYMRSSRPVSGAEHMLSHVWEMRLHSRGGTPALHGQKVALAVQIIGAAYSWLLDRGPEGGDLCAPWDDRLQEKHDLLKREFGELEGYGELKRILDSKYPSYEHINRRREMLITRWEETAVLLKRRLVPLETLKKMLGQAGCPLRAEEIGLERTSAIETLRTAQLIRNRYMIFDALDDLGLLERCISGLLDDPDLLF